MGDKYKSRYFWVKFREGKWAIAQRRFSSRYFVCGVGHIIAYSPIEEYRNISPGDIVKIGEEITCPYT